MQRTICETTASGLRCRRCGLVIKTRFLFVLNLSRFNRFFHSSYYLPFVSVFLFLFHNVSLGDLMFFFCFHRIVALYFFNCFYSCQVYISSLSLLPLANPAGFWSHTHFLHYSIASPTLLCKSDFIYFTNPLITHTYHVSSFLGVTNGIIHFKGYCNTHSNDCKWQTSSPQRTSKTSALLLQNITVLSSWL